MLDKQETIKAGRNQYGSTNEIGLSCAWPRSKSNAEGRKRYGTIENDRPPTESELRENHAKKHSGPFLSCTICEEIAAGTRDIENSFCPECKCDMGDHDSEGKCENCGKQCG